MKQKQPVSPTGSVLDPVTAMHLRHGELFARGTDIVNAALDLWAELALPHGCGIARDPSSRLKDIEAWAREVEDASDMEWSPLLSAGEDGVALGYMSTRGNWSLWFVVSSHTGAAVDRLQLEWEHRGKPSSPLLFAMAPHLESIEAWSDPTPLEMESFRMDARASNTRLGDKFGREEDGSWSVLGFQWPPCKGGFLRLNRGRAGIVTVPQVLSHDLFQAMQAQFGRNWLISRLADPPRPAKKPALALP